MTDSTGSFGVSANLFLFLFLSIFLALLAAV